MNRNVSFRSIFSLSMILVAAMTLAVHTPEANALLISGQDIILAPASVIDDPPGATNSHQQAFNERLGEILSSPPIDH